MHDELVFEVPHDEVEETKRLVKDVMEHASEPTHMLSVPLTVDAGVGPSWGAAH